MVIFKIDILWQIWRCVVSPLGILFVAGRHLGPRLEGKGRKGSSTAAMASSSGERSTSSVWSW
jgi:hypothetical protein